MFQGKILYEVGRLENPRPEAKKANPLKRIIKGPYKLICRDCVGEFFGDSLKQTDPPDNQGHDNLFTVGWPQCEKNYTPEVKQQTPLKIQWLEDYFLSYWVSVSFSEASCYVKLREGYAEFGQHFL